MNANPCQNEDAETKGDDDDGSISAPLVLSRKRVDEVYRMLHSLENHVMRLQVNGEGRWMRTLRKELSVWR